MNVCENISVSVIQHSFSCTVQHRKLQNTNYNDTYCFIYADISTFLYQQLNHVHITFLRGTMECCVPILYNVEVKRYVKSKRKQVLEAHKRKEAILVCGVYIWIYFTFRISNEVSKPYITLKKWMAV